VPVFFATSAKFRAWLDKNAAKEDELLVGFYKTDSGKPSMTWSESVDEALCHGWIDAVRKRVDDVSYTIRFTKRRKTSTWSAINIAKVNALKKAGRMTQAGLDAFAKRSESKSRTYAYEQRAATLDAAAERLIRKNKAAWTYFDAQPPSYKKRMAWWITTAKQDETKAKRIAKLIEFSEKGKRL
jgi:uncharacterized protein YdeI (YjbR/CyaY-like superfamily)